MTSNLWPSCLHPHPTPSTGIIGIHHHIPSYLFLRIKPRFLYILDTQQLTYLPSPKWSLKGSSTTKQTSKQTKLMTTENRLIDSKNQGVKTKLTTKGFENLGGPRYYSKFKQWSDENTHLSKFRRLYTLKSVDLNKCMDETCGRLKT